MYICVCLQSPKGSFNFSVFFATILIAVTCRSRRRVKRRIHKPINFGCKRLFLLINNFVLKKSFKFDLKNRLNFEHDSYIIMQTLYSVTAGGFGIVSHPLHRWVKFIYAFNMNKSESIDFSVILTQSLSDAKLSQPEINEIYYYIKPRPDTAHRGINELTYITFVLKFCIEWLRRQWGFTMYSVVKMLNKKYLRYLLPISHFKRE